MSARKVRIAILDDHQTILDGYRFRLGQNPRIEIVGTAAYGEELETLLARSPVDVVILDVSVPTSPANPNPYPILYTIPRLLQNYPTLAVLVVSMLAERSLIRAVLDAGARYLRIVAPFYPLLGASIALYFASQGAGRMLRPVLAGTARLAIVALGGALVASLAAIFSVVAVGILFSAGLMMWFVSRARW